MNSFLRDPNLLSLNSPFSVFGGTLSGIVLWICPLTIGSGLEPLIFLSETTQLSYSDLPILFATTFLKIVSLAICLSFGMTGGIIYPLFFTGGSFGTAFATATSTNRLLLTSSLSAATLASHIPAPVALWVMAVTMFRGGAGDIWGTWIAVVISIILGCSTGWKEDVYDLARGGLFWGHSAGTGKEESRSRKSRLSVRYEQQLFLNLGVGEMYEDDDNDDEEAEGEIERSN